MFDFKLRRVTHRPHNAEIFLVNSANGYLSSVTSQGGQLNHTNIQIWAFAEQTNEGIFLLVTFLISRLSNQIKVLQIHIYILLISKNVLGLCEWTRS